MKNKNSQTTLGVVVGNRGFFPDQLAKEGRENIIKVLEKQGCKVLVLSPEQSKFGAVETRAEARECAELFKKNRDAIDGIVVTLPNFGDERGVADTLKMADLPVPVLIHAEADRPDKATIEYRRDSFCGKISVCNNLKQYGISYSLTAKHTLPVTGAEFAQEIDKFTKVCRVVKSLRNARIGAIGARPANFNTVRYSEKILENYGTSVETLDLSEVFGRIQKLNNSDPDVKKGVEEIKSYIPTKGIDAEKLAKMAKLAVVIRRFIQEAELDACAVQCWTSIEEYYGIVPCTVMSMLSNELIPNACEVDATGALAMYALQQASGTPSALLDWNNNYSNDENKCVLFHCSNLPKHFFQDFKMDYQAIIAGDVGKENTYGTCEGRVKPSPMTFARFTTEDEYGVLSAYVGEGAFTQDKFNTFGGYGVAEIPNLQKLMQFICKEGFEHHVAVNLSQTADILEEAFTNYLDISTYRHV